MLREVLIISRNEDMTRWMQWSLEDLGFAVELSSSLEQSFFGAHSTPFMVVVDADVISEDDGHAKQYLAWLHRRSPILLVANSESCDQLREECDLCLPQALGREKFLAGIRKLGGL